MYKVIYNVIYNVIHNVIYSDMPPSMVRLAPVI